MNKKILLSVSTIAIVAGIVIGGTIAFFSDTETSNGNIFTAGSIDLKVDHTRQTYDGIDCKTCSAEVYSSTSTRVVAASAGAAFPAVPYNAADVASPNPAWQNEAALAPAQWIWASDPTAVVDTTNGVEYTFENKFQWNGSVASVNLALALAADNGYKIVLNGTEIVNKLGDEFNYGAAVPLTVSEQATFIGAMIVSGENTLDIVVRNLPLNAGSAGNPAGLLFKLNVQRPQTECAADSYFQRNCTLWQSKDLGANDKFFNFDDIKPGDFGTNVISLHVDSNNAYVCMLTKNKQNLENGLVDPEIALGDNDTTGELSQFLNLVVWEDKNGNGIYEPGTEGATLYNGLFDNLPTIGRLPLSTNGSDNLGIAWCLGAQNVASDGTISCSGTGNQNIAQTDKLIADIVLYAVQQRNNDTFSCANVILPTN